MLDYLLLAGAAVFIFGLGAVGAPLSKSWFKSWSLKRAVANAKALVAKAEADAAALEAAKKVVAGATGPAGV